MVWIELIDGGEFGYQDPEVDYALDHGDDNDDDDDDKQEVDTTRSFQPACRRPPTTVMNQ